MKSKKITHSSSCDCFRCKHGEAHYQAHINKAMKEFGWYAHFVVDACSYPNHSCIVTRGLPESFGHTNLQMCFPMREEVAHEIFRLAIEQIKEGTKFIADGQTRYSGILGNNFRCMFIERKDGSLPVYRLLIPNPDDQFTGLPYINQFL